MNLEFWTDFADGAIMFPLGVAIPVVLALFGQRRAAIAWTAVIGCVWTVMLVLKLSGYTIAALYPASFLCSLDLVTPSGHVASSAAIYGGLLGLLLSRPGTLVQRAVPAAVGIAIVIGSTRVFLGAHSLSEAVVGGLVGIAGAAGVASLAGVGLPRRARLPVIAATVLVIIAFHGDHATAEDTIRETALRITQFWTAHS